MKEYTWPLTMRPLREATGCAGPDAGTDAGATVAGAAALAATATGLRSMLAIVVDAGLGAATTGRGAGRVSRV